MFVHQAIGKSHWDMQLERRSAVLPSPRRFSAPSYDQPNPRQHLLTVSFHRKIFQQLGIPIVAHSPFGFIYRDLKDNKTFDVAGDAIVKSMSEK